MLTHDLKTTGVLFIIDEEKLSENGPIYSGSVNIGDKRVSLSAFLKQSKTNGMRYLDLSLGEKGEVHFSGRLFRNEKRKSDKSPQYTGFFTILPLTPKPLVAPVAQGSGKRNAKSAPAEPQQQYTTEDWDNAPQLSIFANWMQNSDGQGKRMVLDIVPARRRVETDADETVPF
jgi:hypothetical protein